MSRSLGVTALCLSAALLPVISRAATPTVLFSDNFETTANGGNDVENGSDPATGSGTNTTPLHADIGSYINPETNGRVIAYGGAISNPTQSLTVNQTAPAATATGGADLLRLQPPSGGSRVVGRLSQPASVQGSTFHLEFDLYAQNNDNFGFGSQNPGEFGLRTGLSSTSVTNSRPGQSVAINLASGNVQIQTDADGNPSTTNTFSNTGLTFTSNTFQHYQIDYVIGSTQFRLTQTKDVSGTPTTAFVDFTTSNGISPFLSCADSDFSNNTNPPTPYTVPSLSQVDTIFFGTGSAGSPGFVDNISATGVAFAGDANHDRGVNGLDFNAVASNFGVTTNAGWTMGDFNADGAVNTVDFDLLAANFNGTLSAPALGSVVPEPTCLGVLGVAGLLVGRSRKSFVRE